MTARPSGARILIVGFYGFGNAGDELILSAIVAALRERVPSAAVEVVSGRPDETARLHGVGAVEWSDPLAVLAAVQRCDLVIVGGGGLLHEYWPFDPADTLSRRPYGLPLSAGPAVAGALFEKPVFLYGVGAGPLTSPAGKQFLRGIFDASTRVTVRDDLSAAVFRSVDAPAGRVRTTADPAFLLAPAPRDAAGPEEGTTILVSVRPWSFFTSPDRWEVGLAAGLDRVLDAGDARVLFVSFQRSPHAHENDQAAGLRVMRRMRRRERARIATISNPMVDLPALFSRARVVVGMRLHSIVLAAIHGVVPVALAYDAKVTATMRRLDVAAYAVPLADLEPEALADAVSGALSDESARARMEAAVRALRAAAGSDADAAAALLREAPRTRELTPALSAILARTLRSRMFAEASLEHVREEASIARAEADRARAETSRAKDDLERIYGLRFWKIASAYWRAIGAVRGALGRRRAPENAPAASPPVAAPAIPASETAEFPAARPHDVICLPIIDWDFRFQRPQQLMTRLAAAGHRVFYVAQRMRPSGPPFTVREVAPRVLEVSLRSPERNVYRDTLDAAAEEELVRSIRALRRDQGIGTAAIVAELPFWWPLARRLRRDHAWPVVYDCMDFHAGFSTNRPDMLRAEEEMFSGADLVVVSSAALEREARSRSGNVLLLRNACDFDHFTAARRSGSSAPPVVGYYGAIADWFDADLVADLAERRPDWRFLLVGSTWSADLARLGRLANVELPGEKPYAEIPDWLRRFDVAIVPFKRVPLTEATNPVKAYEILAAGKPLVSVPLPEVVPMAPRVRLASTPADFEREIAAALAESDPALPEARRIFAAENTWEKRVETLRPALARSFPPVSVVIVTYGGLPLNRLCLASVLGSTEWPNLEVIVVDNGSSDGTPEFLREQAARDPRLRVIVNPTNLGFAAANNIGLEHAAGDVFVLLNNDTVVPPGWLAPLVAHLSDPAIGLLGPVTNAIGNEARIPVGYRTIEEMPAWAARYVREHDGETFEIPTLAMFCLALSRRVFTDLGPLDERFGVGMFEDDDYSRRANEAGLRVVCARDAFVHHWMKASFERMPAAEYEALFTRNRLLFEEKWGTTWMPHRGPEETAAAPGGEAP